MNSKELKFRLLEEWKKTLVILKYLFLDPYYETKKLIAGYYNSTLIFWLAVLVFVSMWSRGIIGKQLKAMGIIVLLVYVYMFIKSKKWKEYYEKEMIKGEKI